MEQRLVPRDPRTISCSQRRVVFAAYRRGDEFLSGMPADDTPGRRIAVTKYEVAVRMSA